MDFNGPKNVIHTSCNALPGTRAQLGTPGARAGNRLEIEAGSMIQDIIVTSSLRLKHAEFDPMAQDGASHLPQSESLVENPCVSK